MTGPDGADNPADGRQRYLVRVVKRADPAERVVFRQLFPDQAALDEHGWCDAFGALDDDSASLPGTVAWFSVELDPTQVAAFAQDDDVTAMELEPPEMTKGPPLLPRLAEDPGIGPDDSSVVPGHAVGPAAGEVA